MFEYGEVVGRKVSPIDPAASPVYLPLQGAVDRRSLRLDWIVGTEARSAQLQARSSANGPITNRRLREALVAVAITVHRPLFFAGTN